MRSVNPHLLQLARSAVASLECEVIGVECIQTGGGHLTVRVYIDKPDAGVTVDDCAAVSHQLSGLLDVADPIPGQYDLEVSSPGLDRPLFETAHFIRFTGQRARVRLTAKFADRRNFEGLLAGVNHDQTRLQLDVNGELFELPIDLIDSARLVPHF